LDEEEPQGTVMDKILDELIGVLMDAQDALNEQETHVWIDGYGYPMAEEE
jgi:hypothetical protein